VSSATNTSAQPAESAESERYMREQIEIIMAKEAEEANEAVEIARRATREDEDREKQVAAQTLWEEKKKTQTKQQVNQKIHSYLTTLAEETKTSVQADWRDQEQLKQSKKTIAEELEHLRKTKEQLEQHIATVHDKTGEIEQWLEESKDNKQDEEANVDDLCQPVSKLHAQMLDLSAENAALTDALYFLDRGMYMGQMDCNTHLKSVRNLAKRQFLVRAHLIKIDQVLLKNGR
jgi:ESCRT-I complex subunit TSG101